MTRYKTQTNTQNKQTKRPSHIIYSLSYMHTLICNIAHTYWPAITPALTHPYHTYIYKPTHYQYLHTFNKYKLCYVQDFFQHLSTKCVPFQQLTLASKSSLHAQIIQFILAFNSLTSKHYSSHLFIRKNSRKSIDGSDKNRLMV